ncbi:hypothetical protein HELRODRAFT_89391, partial [Helobdella robusta]|uniref:Twinfilin n=1 Tax=Helobdella robusta TaxID=6412 RepID=T1G7C7_HELRO
ATTELKSAISQAKLGQIRLIKMIINSENLSLEKVIKPIGTWQQDFDNAVLPCLKVNQPCYILYKLDSRYQQDGSPEWLLITYVPDTTQTREKMIYASTKMTMKKAISALHIKYDYAATTINECSYEGFNSYIRSLTAPKPLTKAEIELQQIKKNEMRTQGKKQTLQSISFPLTPELEDALLLFKSAEVNYIQICIDIAKEVISLAVADKITTAQLRNLIPTDKPRYHLFSFNHRGNIFIHSIPVGKSTIKEKMLYSTCKMTFLQRVEADLKIPVARKIETDSPDELTEEYLVDQLSSSSSSSSFPPAARFNSSGAVGDVNFRHQRMFHNLGSPAFH